MHGFRNSEKRSPARESGFASPAADYAQNTLSLDELIIEHPSSTFFMKAQGHGMNPLFFDGDILVVDRVLKAKNNSLIVLVYRDELLVRRCHFLGCNEVELLTPHGRGNLKMNKAQLEIWGVVSTIVRRVG